MFLLIYNIIREASTAQVFSAIFPAATVIFQIIPIILLASTYQQSSYRPYKPKPRWRKKLKAGLAKLSDTICSRANYATELISSGLEKVLGKARRPARRLPVGFVRRYQSYYWTTYNHKKRGATQARWRCFWAMYAISAARTASTFECRVTQAGGRATRHQASFDSDSYDIMVDNCCSYSITNNLSDYIKPPTTANVQVRGYAGATTDANKVGTVKWSIEDDTGAVHDLILPGTYYSPKAEHRMLSPQHWCQIANDHKPIKNGTVCVTQADSVILKWGQLKHTRTIPLTRTTNIGVLKSAPGTDKYNALCALCEGDPILAFPSTIITSATTEPARVVSDDEEEPTTYVPAQGLDDRKAERLRRLKHQFTALREERTANRQEKMLELSIEEEENFREAVAIDFNLGEEESTSIPMPIDDPKFDDDQLTYQHFHEKLSHAPKSRMAAAIQAGILPKRLAKVKPPPCPACLSGKATRKAWRARGGNREIIKTTTPGECTSVDQLESPTPGFMGLLKGQPTRRRYKAATVFKDHFSKVKYVHYMEKITS